MHGGGGISYAIVTGMLSVRVADLFLGESRLVSKLTVVALMFIPLSFTASLFSIGWNFQPGRLTFWGYFCTGAAYDAYNSCCCVVVARRVVYLGVKTILNIVFDKKVIEFVAFPPSNSDTIYSSTPTPIPFSIDM